MVVIITVDSIIVLTKLQSTERYLAKLFFASNFVNFQSILAAHQKKKNVPKFFRKFTQKNTVARSYFSKVAGFYRSSHLRCSSTCVRDSILTKGCKKETLAQVFSCEFCEISENNFFTEYLRTNASAISFFLQLY